MAMALNMFLCMLWLSDHLGIMPEVSFVNPKVTIWFRGVFVCDGGGAGAVLPHEEAGGGRARGGRAGRLFNTQTRGVSPSPPSISRP